MPRIDAAYYQNARLAGYVPPGNWQHLYAAPLMAMSNGADVSRFGRDGFRGLGECTWEEAHRLSHEQGLGSASAVDPRTWPSNFTPLPGSSVEGIQAQLDAFELAQMNSPMGPKGFAGQSTQFLFVALAGAAYLYWKSTKKKRGK